MANPLHVLILEDNPGDTELMLQELRRAGFEPVWQRVKTKTDYLAKLDPAPDLILADYNLPQLDAQQALALLQERELDIPFIIVSDAIGEEPAVSAIKQGAADYLLKDRLSPLGPAVGQVLEQKQLRDKKRRVETTRKEQSERLEEMVEERAKALQEAQAEAAGSRQLLPALSQAAQAVQRARTPDKVYRIVGDEVAKLGYHGYILTLTADRTRLILSHITYEPALLATIEKLVGMSARKYSFAIVPGSIYDRVIAKKQTIFSERIVEDIADALHASIRPLAKQLATLLKLKKGICGILFKR